MSYQASGIDYNWGWQLASGTMAEAVHAEFFGVRLATTGMHHPFGAGHTCINGTVWTWPGVLHLEAFRQVVRVDGVWHDCLMIRDLSGIQVMEDRIVSEDRAVHVAQHYGIEVVKNGCPVPQRDGHPVQHKPYTPQLRKQVGRSFDLAAFRAEFVSKFPQDAGLLDDLVREMQVYYELAFSETAQAGVMSPCAYPQGVIQWPISIYTDGTIEVPWQWIKRKAPWSGFRELYATLVVQFGFLGKNVMLNPNGRPRVPFSVLRDPAAFAKLVEALHWFFEAAFGFANGVKHD